MKKIFFVLIDSGYIVMFLRTFALVPIAMLIFLEFNKFDTEEKSFLILLKEIEKEGIVDIDTWDEFRKIRNNIAHEYPGEEEEGLEAIELLVKKSKDLTIIAQKIMDRYYETR